MNRIGSIVSWTAIAIVALTAIACAGAGPAATLRPAAYDPSSGDLSGRPAAPGDEPSGDENQAPGQAVAGPLVVHTGSLSIETSDMRASVDQATAAVNGLGGYVASSHEDNSPDHQSASVTYRIPATSWTQAVTALRGIGQRVIAEDTQAEDVTAQVVDLDARIANLRSSETALQQIMTQATTISDVLKVQEELTSVRSEIESMSAQRDNLADRAAFGTLTVYFNVPTPSTALATGGWDLGREVDRAFATLVRLSQGLASLAVWVAIVIVPVLVPILIAAWIGIRLRRRFGSQPEQPSTPVA